MLIEDALATAAIVLAVALVSGLTAFWDAGSAGRGDRAALLAGLGWGIFAVGAGLLATALYRWMDVQWPGVGTSAFVAAAIGGTVLLSLAAVVLRPRPRWVGAPEAVALNLVWGVGFGVAIPLVLQ